MFLTHVEVAKCKLHETTMVLRWKNSTIYLATFSFELDLPCAK
jgi:hypothetical protein